MTLIERARLSLAIGFLAGLAYAEHSGASMATPTWQVQMYVSLMSAAPLLIFALVLAAIAGLVTYRTKLRNWWYPGSRISTLVESISMIGLIAVAALPRYAPAEIAEWRLTAYTICLCGVFLGLMGFSKHACTKVEK